MASTTVTFEVPGELRDFMDRHPEVNWGAVLSEAIVRHARTIDLAKRILEEGDNRRIVEMTERLKRGAGVRVRRAAHTRSR